MQLLKILPRLAPLVLPAHAAVLDARAAAKPTVADGDFENLTLKPYWTKSQLGAPITLTTDPTGRGGQSLRIANIDCENEEYADITGNNIQNLVAGTTYNLTFQYLHQDDTDNVDWSVIFFPPPGTCNPCPGYLPKTETYPKSVTAGIWNTYSATFKAPKSVDKNGGRLSMDVAPLTCGYSGSIFLDNFALAKV